METMYEHTSWRTSGCIRRTSGAEERALRFSLHGADARTHICTHIDNSVIPCQRPYDPPPSPTVLTPGVVCDFVSGRSTMTSDRLWTLLHSCIYIRWLPDMMSCVMWMCIRPSLVRHSPYMYLDSTTYICIFPASTCVCAYCYVYVTVSVMGDSEYYRCVCHSCLSVYAYHWLALHTYSDEIQATGFCLQRILERSVSTDWI